MLRPILLILSILPLFLLAQIGDEPGTAFIVMDDYAAPQVTEGSLSAATSSGAANCGTTADDDVFYTFQSESKAVKITLSSTQFDGVLEIWDNANQSIGCLNDINGIGDEILYLNNLIPGDLYHVRIHSANGVSGTGEFSIEYVYLPLWELQPNYRETSIDGDNYRLYDQLRRSIDGAINIQSTRWRLHNVNTGITHEYVVPNNPSNNAYGVMLDDIEVAVATVADPFMCYGDIIVFIFVID